MECANCGKLGHIFRGCRAPVMSFGICAIKLIHSIPYYLLIRRRDSLSYVEFLRGKYDVTNHNYIQCLMNGMTIEERGRLLAKSFDTLWYELWNGQNTRQYRSECATAKKHFEDLATKGDSDGKLLKTYVDGTKTTWTEPEWGFPKGRRAVRESELNCACREFKEETGISEICVNILDEPPLIEQYLGTNGIMYKQTYYIGACSPTLVANVQAENRIMQREVGGIGWFTYDEAFAHIRDTNKEKRILLESLNMQFARPEFLSKFIITDEAS